MDVGRIRVMDKQTERGVEDEQDETRKTRTVKAVVLRVDVEGKGSGYRQNNGSR